MKKLSSLLPAALLFAAMALSVFLHFTNIAAIGDGNLYYTAALESMLQSPHNFFFIAAEPGGSVTIDKPPLGLWIQAVFAALLGVSGFSAALPNILAGIACVPILYYLVRRSFGQSAGLLAAFSMAVTPVVFAADRNNTHDGLLTLVLLLAAWAFLNAARTDRLGQILTGAVLIGLGFNIKMMQAFLPLPAFYAVYLFSAPAGWGRKLARLGLASLVIGVLALAWPLAVDSIPPDQRPYIGSSSTNSVLELIVDYNGLDRLLGEMRGPGPLRGFPGGPPPPGQPGDALPPLFGEIGAPGPLRFFQPPLAKELSWLLPFGLVGLLLAALAARLRLLPRDKTARGLLVWGGWLLTCLVFFSIAGFFHAYYLIMLVPPLSACLGMGLAAGLALRPTRPRLAALALLAAAGLTFGLQVSLVNTFSDWADWGWLAAAALLIGCLLVLLSLTRHRLSDRSYQAGTGLLMVGLLIIPLAWSALTVRDDTPNNLLPAAYGGSFGLGSTVQVGGFPPAALRGNGPVAQLLAVLQENTQDVRYLAAVPSSMFGAPLVVETGRPVFYLGGFNGTDRVIDAAGLESLVADRELRYVIYNPGDPVQSDPEISGWLEASCARVEGYNISPGAFLAGSLAIYDCFAPPG